MKTIAVISDIHGNMPALEAVLVDLERRRPDEILVGGDLVGRGPEGSRAVRAIAARGWPAIRGNHEEYLLGFRRGEVPSSWMESEEWAASRWMAAELSEDDVRYIASLPFSLRPSSAPGLLLIHGSPSSTNEGLGPWTDDRSLARHLDSVEESLLVCAHTHRPMHRRLEGGVVVNVGSVGLPFNRDHRAQYALFHHHHGGWEVEFRQVEYDLRRTLRVYESSGFLDSGGVTARLLRLELEQAAPFLVPFQKWAAARGVPADSGRLPSFLEEYDPDLPLGEFLCRLEALGSER